MSDPSLELAEARQAVLQRDRLIARLAHELRDPVATLLLWETILRDARDDQLRQQALDAIRRSAQTQESLVSSMLDLARLLAGTLILDRRPIVIGDVVADALVRIAPQAAAKQLRVDREHGAEQELVSADPARLRQILSSMVSSVVVRAEPGDGIVVSIRREGSSILIDVFVGDRPMAHAVTPDDEVPHGLELALARELAIAHGGVLVVSRTGTPPSARCTLSALT